MAHLILLTKPLKMTLKSKGYVLKCHRCGKDLKPEESVVSRRVGRSSSRRYYHPACWDSLFF